ncbi:hypothetical protein ACWDA7_50520 [Streptomyces sp. NPDC001156]
MATRLRGAVLSEDDAAMAPDPHTPIGMPRISRVHADNFGVHGVWKVWRQLHARA